MTGTHPVTVAPLVLFALYCTQDILTLGFFYAM